MDCVFCKIINREIPSKILFENENVIAFEDNKPVAKVHVLVIPKKHINSIIDVQETEMSYIADIHRVIKEVAKIKKIDESGFRVIVNCGKDSGQTVNHLHYHIIGGEKLPQ